MKQKRNLVLINLIIILLVGCVNYSRESGVENLWRQSQNFTNGKTTTKQILSALGPPSQVLALGDKTIYYYLKEEVTREGLILLIYNTTKEITLFDRAIFIFTEQGILEDFSYTKQNKPK